MKIQQQVCYFCVNIFYIDRFKSTMREDVAIKALEDARIQNSIIEEVIDKIRNDDPKFDIILSRLIAW